MPIKYVDRLVGPPPADKPRQVPSPFGVLAAQAGIQIPAYGKIPLNKVDAALKGLPIEQRMRLKAMLHEAGFIN